MRKTIAGCKVTELLRLNPHPYENMPCYRKVDCYKHDRLPQR